MFEQGLAGQQRRALRPVGAVEVMIEPLPPVKSFRRPGRVTVRLRDGRTLAKQVDYPKGDPRNPLSDAEIEEKFRALADGVLSKKAQDKLIAAIWNLEKVGPVSKLMALMKADVKKKASRTASKTRAKGKKR